MYSHHVEKAICAASILHQDQLRMGSVPLPYISHLIATVLILSHYTKNEDVLCAAFLHDTLEDTDYTETELREDFGENIAELVITLTEPTYDDQGNKLSWIEKKRLYAKQLKQGREEALLIAAADKMHNFRSIIDEYHNDHMRYIRDFGPRTLQRLEAYQTIANVINSRLKSDIVHEFNHAFTEFKQFLTDVEKTTNTI